MISFLAFPVVPGLIFKLQSAVVKIKTKDNECWKGTWIITGFWVQGAEKKKGKKKHMCSHIHCKSMRISNTRFTWQLPKCGISGVNTWV